MVTSQLQDSQEAINQRINNLFDDLRNDVETYQSLDVGPSVPEEEVYRKAEIKIGEAQVLKELNKSLREEMSSLKESHIREADSLKNVVDSLKEEVEILKSSKLKEERRYKEENRKLRGEVDTLEENIDMVFEWLGGNAEEYRSLEGQEKIDKLEKMLHEKEEDKKNEIEELRSKLHSSVKFEHPTFRPNQSYSSERSSEESMLMIQDLEKKVSNYQV